MLDREILAASDLFLVELFAFLIRHQMQPDEVHLVCRIARELRYREMHREWTGLPGPIHPLLSKNG